MRFSDAQIDRMTQAVVNGEDGHTEFMFDNADGSYRYVVGGAGTVMTKSAEQWQDPAQYDRIRERIAAWAAENADAETLGFWVDGDEVIFDAGETFAYEGQALSIGRQRGEKEIFDRTAGECIVVK